MNIAFSPVGTLYLVSSRAEVYEECTAGLGVWAIGRVGENPPTRPDSHPRFPCVNAHPEVVDRITVTNFLTER